MQSSTQRPAAAGTSSISSSATEDSTNALGNGALPTNSDSFAECVEWHCRQNLMFRELLLPQRFIAELDVLLLGAKDLVAKNWLMGVSNP